MNTYPEYHLVQQCLLEIENRLDWGSSDSWHNDVFIELSEHIQKETQVNLSTTTLKRVWGKVKYQNAPSISTLNTLSKFAGYENWRAFKNKKEPKKKPSLIKDKVFQNMGIIVAAAGIMTFAFISFFSMVSTENDNIPPLDLSKIHFKSRPISKGLPNSVVFDLNLDEITSDSIYIQQFWDRTKTVKIKPKQKQATGIYYYPGYFRAKLLVDGKIIKEHDLFIASDEWMGTIDYEPIPKYINVNDTMSDPLSFSDTVVKEIKENKNPIVSTFHLVKDFNMSGDDMTIETTVKNIYNEKWAVCQTLRIVVLGSSGAMIIPFSIPGCVSDINLMLNDVYVRGKEHDLSSLGTDLSDFKKLKINVENNKVTVYIEDQEVYSNNYHEPIGKFVGIRYRFLGAGSIKELTITDQKTNQIVLKDHFFKI